MTTELQNRAWSILPKEFKEEVKKEWQDADSDYRAEDVLENIFGFDNLTSDAEEDVELLHVTRQKVMGLYANAKKIQDLYTSATCINTKESQQIDICKGVMSILDTLFGSKCLPEPSKLQASCRQVNVDSSHGNVDSLHGNVDSLEPKPAEPNPDGDNLTPEPQPANRTPSSYTQPVTDCHQIDRLHIAAMAMQGILSNANWMKRYKDIALYPLPDNLTRIVARNALRYADALVAESHK